MIQLHGLNVQKQIVTELKEAGPYAKITDIRKIDTTGIRATNSF